MSGGASGALNIDFLKRAYNSARTNEYTKESLSIKGWKEFSGQFPKHYACGEQEQQFIGPDELYFVDLEDKKRHIYASLRESIIDLLKINKENLAGRALAELILREETPEINDIFKAKLAGMILPKFLFPNDLSAWKEASALSLEIVCAVPHSLDGTAAVDLSSPNVALQRDSMLSADCLATLAAIASNAPGSEVVLTVQAPCVDASNSVPILAASVSDPPAYALSVMGITHELEVNAKANAEGLKMAAEHDL